MASNFGKSFSPAVQLLRFSPGWSCSSIPSFTHRSQGIPRLAQAHSIPPVLPNNTERYFSAIRCLHTNTTNQDAQPKTDENRQKRKHKGKNSLRRVAVEAQRSQEMNIVEKSINAVNQPIPKMVVAFCAAEQYDIAHVSRTLDSLGYQQDPYGTDLYPQVIHVETPIQGPPSFTTDDPGAKGDIFVFPSGAVVGWGVPKSILSKMVTETLLPAAQQPHIQELEEEDLQFVEDSTKEYSSIRGETIILGTKTRAWPMDTETSEPSHDGRSTPSESKAETDSQHIFRRETVLAKIAFSSGLAKSTKLAVLESQLTRYFETTKSMVDCLSRGKRMRMWRTSILSQTGHLLGIRAQLNLYSELTDSLPDLFWDSRSELGLEGYYDHVGRALDTNIRVKQLNEKMNYAQEIANVLREVTSERKSVRLETIIMVLVGVEVMFNFLHEYRYLSGVAGFL